MSSAPCGEEHGDGQTDAHCDEQQAAPTAHGGQARVDCPCCVRGVAGGDVVQSGDTIGGGSGKAGAHRLGELGSLVRLGERTVVACRLSGLRLPCQCPGGNGRVFRHACEVHGAPGNALSGHHGQTPATHTTGQKRTSSRAIEHTPTAREPAVSGSRGARE